MERLRSGDESREKDVTHPTTAEWLAAFAMTLKEIQWKHERGESLQPMLKNLQRPIVPREVRFISFAAS
jgi:hypothetical protein